MIVFEVAVVGGLVHFVATRPWRQKGMSVETLLNAIRDRGARATLPIIDASRRNPYERCFRSCSNELAPINARNSALIISSSTPGKVADVIKAQHACYRVLNELNANISAEGVFNKTRIASFAPLIVRK